MACLPLPFLEAVNKVTSITKQSSKESLNIELIPLAVHTPDQQEASCPCGLEGPDTAAGPA